jgi:TPR repeat protein
MQLNQYAKGEWRNEYQRVGAQVDEDFDAYLKRLMLTQCKQKITMFRHLANQGNPWAMYQLGQAHSKGLGVTQDDAAAQDWYKQAALNEYTDAYLALGALNTDGIAFPPKLTDAFEWYMKAAQQGNAQAQFIVAGQYRNGQGVARDLSQAEAWYKKSAQQNYPNAKTKLVEMVKAGEIKKSRFGW